MPDDRPNMRRLFNDDKDVDSLRQMDEARFEEEIVNHLFSRYNLARSRKSKLLGEHRDLHGHFGLSLAAFGEEFPSFPIHLIARKFSKMREQNPVHKILADFLNRNCVQEFERLKDELPEGIETYGLVVHWGFLKATGKQKVDERASAVILHNREPRVDVVGAVRAYCVPRKRAARIYVETLSAFLTTIDKESPGGRWTDD